MFAAEYQYSNWTGICDLGGSRLWIDVDKEFGSKAARTRYINQMNEKYSSVFHRVKGDIESLRISTKVEEELYMTDKTVIAYTDGSVHWKDKLGGLGVYLKFGEEVQFISRGYSNTTNNRMELRAAIEAMKAVVKKDYILHIYSDSELVVNTFTSWIFKWEKDSYVERKNVDILKEGIIEYRKFPLGNVIFHWCKGHSGIEGNEIADCLAGDGRASGEYTVCNKEE